jgi:hypothetical protein
MEIDIKQELERLSKWLADGPAYMQVRAIVPRTARDEIDRLERLVASTEEVAARWEGQCQALTDRMIAAGLMS